MLLLLIKLGSDVYGLDVMDVVEVIPRIEARPVPQSPDYVAGLIAYRGTVVPLIDLKQLMVKEPCVPWLSTRIIITEYDIRLKRVPALRRRRRAGQGRPAAKELERQRGG